MSKPSPETCMFTFIEDRMPPINKPIVLRLFDLWRGPGNEVEFVDAEFNGRNFVTSPEREKILEGLVTGWGYCEREEETVAEKPDISLLVQEEKMMQTILRVHCELMREACSLTRELMKGGHKNDTTASVSAQARQLYHDFVKAVVYNDEEPEKPNP